MATPTPGSSTAAYHGVIDSGVQASAPVIQRTKRWLYILPVAAAPLAHIFVSMMKQHPQYRRPLLGLVVASTVLAVGNRVFLMQDAGYPGVEGSKGADRFSDTAYAEEEQEDGALMARRQRRATPQWAPAKRAAATTAAKGEARETLQ